MENEKTPTLPPVLCSGNAQRFGKKGDFLLLIGHSAHLLYSTESTDYNAYASFI